MQTINDLLLRAAAGEATERPPVWLMRQAGRILPEYRAIRNKLSGFKELVTTPELATEVTIQPVDALGVDAAIIFSDILVIPECMGLDYDMVEKRGPLFRETIANMSDIDRLQTGEAAADRLEYVYEAVRMTRRELAGRVPLIGFAGAPWTLLAYMVEGSGSKTFSRARRMLYQSPEAAHKLLKAITDTTVSYLRRKVEAGAQLIQLFDSWAGILPPEQYGTFALPYLKTICESLPDVPVTVFARGAWASMEEINALPCQVVGLDWNTPPDYARMLFGKERVLQGNLDPCMLYGTEKQIEDGVGTMLQSFGNHHIVNLGHGVYPDTSVEKVRYFVELVKSFRYN